MFNAVYLSPTLFDKLLGEKSPNGLYLKVANLVCRAYRDASMSDIDLDVNFLTYDRIKDQLVSYDNGFRTWIGPFFPHGEKVATIEKGYFQVNSCGNLNSFGRSNEPKAILASTIENLIRSASRHEILTLKQSLFIKHPVLGPLKVVLNNWRQECSDKDTLLTDDSAPYYGTLTEKTKIKITSSNKNELILVEEFDPEKIETFYFKISKVIDVSERVFCSDGYASQNNKDWKKGIQPLPLTVNVPSLTKKIREEFSGKLIHPGKTEKFAYDKDWSYEVQLIKVQVTPTSGKSLYVDEDGKGGNMKVFELQDNHLLTISNNSDVILTTDLSNARTAEELTFEIIDISSSRPLENNEIQWVSLQELKEAITRRKQILPVDGKTVLTINDTKYLLKVIKASGKEAPYKDECSNLKDVWAVNDGTEIKAYSKKTLELEIVDTPKAYVLNSLTVTVSQPSSGGHGVLFSLLGGEEEKSTEKTIIPEEEIKKIFLQSLPKDGVLHEKQTFSGITGKGKQLKFKLDKLISKEKTGCKFYHGCIFKYLPETNIIVEGEKGSDIVIATAPRNISFDNIDQKLVEYGIGGMTEQFKDVISRAILSRSSYAGHIAAIGQKPSRGLLLYGPPGTGKTLLARQLGNILGVTKERIKLYTGSQIWNKWLGESEKNVRNMFVDAREDQNRLGKDSPMHLIIIDEIDAFLQDRNNATQRYETSVVNTFIAELDGVSSNGEDSLNNVLVVGLTNFPDRLDEAVKRPGRLFPHIHIGIPDSQGRKEIFNIHTKHIKEGGFLGDDVDVDEIVKMTVGKTGALIEGIVAAAAEYSLKRLWEQRVPAEKIKEHPAAKLYMADFKKGFEECLHQKKNEETPLVLPSTPLQAKEMSLILRDLGLGGLPQELTQFLADLKLSQHYKEFLSLMKHPFPRGALIYGPPGTGKRSFAKAIKKIFHLEGQKFQYYKASELWPMQGSNLKSTIEKIIQPAKDASHDLKHEAPLHVVVIDEIDMLYLHRREPDQHNLSVMNQFLAEIESLLEGNPKEVNNLLVIGLAHRSSLGLPAGIQLHGRLGKHLEMTLPDAKGRKEIFEIYLKEYIKKDLLDKEVTLDKLVEITRDQSGAFIEGLVSEAAVRLMREFAGMNASPDKIMDEGCPKLKMRHFQVAFEAMETEKRRNPLVI